MIVERHWPYNKKLKKRKKTGDTNKTFNIPACVRIKFSKP